MEDISKIFLFAFNAVFEKKHGAQVALARATGIDPSYLNRILKGTAPGSDQNKRAIAEALGYPGKKYEDFLDIGRQALGLIKAQTKKNPISPETESYLMAALSILTDPRMRPMFQHEIDHYRRLRNMFNDPENFKPLTKKEQKKRDQEYKKFLEDYEAYQATIPEAEKERLLQKSYSEYEAHQDWKKEYDD